MSSFYPQASPHSWQNDAKRSEMQFQGFARQQSMPRHHSNAGCRPFVFLCVSQTRKLASSYIERKDYAIRHPLLRLPGWGLFLSGGSRSRVLLVERRELLQRRPGGFLDCLVPRVPGKRKGQGEFDIGARRPSHQSTWNLTKVPLKGTWSCKTSCQVPC